MEFEKIKELISMVDASSLTEFEYTQADYALRMSKNEVAFQTGITGTTIEETKLTQPGTAAAAKAEPAAPQSAGAAQPAVEAEGKVIYSPLVGVAYLQPDPESPAYVNVGDTVKAGQVVCLVEAMKIMNEIKSEWSGTITEILIENEQVVEFNQPLFRIK